MLRENSAFNVINSQGNSQTSVGKHLLSWIIQFSTKLLMEENVLVVKENFGSLPDNPFMLICVWSVTRMIQFLNKLLLEQPSGTNSKSSRTQVPLYVPIK